MDYVTATAILAIFNYAFVRSRTAFLKLEAPAYVIMGVITYYAHNVLHII